MGMYDEYCLRAQVAVLLMLGLYCTVLDRYMQVFYLGRAPRTKETLPDFREKCRVARHSRVFRGLTGSQRTPRIWGVTVLVKKANDKWRLYIDFTDVNKACPKDSFPLPRIDLIVDATAGHELLSFMDAFSGYNQISMDPDDQEKTSFVTAQGTYCYRVMPYELKNVGATY